MTFPVSKLNAKESRATAGADVPTAPIASVAAATVARISFFMVLSSGLMPLNASRKRELRENGKGDEEIPRRLRRLEPALFCGFGEFQRNIGPAFGLRHQRQSLPLGELPELE